MPTARTYADGAQSVLELARGKDRAETLAYRGIEYVRLLDDVAGLRRGTCVVQGRLLPVYPSIGRIFALRAGIRRTFSGPFQAEEKVDGYNVRIVRVDGRSVAFTRGGYLCPFTTDRLPDLVDLDSLFDEAPDAVVCAEVAGPGNPYIQVPCAHAECDVGLFAFDVMRGRLLPPPEADALLERHGVPRAPRVGVFGPEDFEPIREAVLRLDGLAVEGVVLKDLAGGPRVKYVTPTVNLSDLVEDGSLLAELPPAFFTSRLLRLVMGLDELGLWDRTREVEARLGHGLVGELRRALEGVRRTGIVSRTFTVRLRKAESADALLSHLSRSSRTVQVHEVERRTAGAYLLLTFRKTFLQSTSYLKTLLGGEALVD